MRIPKMRMDRGDGWLLLPMLLVLFMGGLLLFGVAVGLFEWVTGISTGLL